MDLQGALCMFPILLYIIERLMCCRRGLKFIKHTYGFRMCFSRSELKNDLMLFSHTKIEGHLQGCTGIERCSIFT